MIRRIVWGVMAGIIPVVLFLLSVLPMLARADTVAATNTTTYLAGTANYANNCNTVGYAPWDANNTSRWGSASSAESACASFYSGSGGCSTGWTTFTGTSNGWNNVAYATCGGGTRGVYAQGGACPTGYTNFNYQTGNCSKVTQTCPANSSGPVGGLCTCTGGYVASGGQCVQPTCASGQHWDGTQQACVADCPSGQFKGVDGQCHANCQSGQTWSGSISISGSPGLVCNNGCESTPIQGNNQCAVGGVQKWCGSWVQNGAQCTGSETAAAQGAPDLNCAPNQSVGNVNGILVCSTPTQANPIQSISTESSSVQNTNVSGATTAGPSTSSSTSTSSDGQTVTETTTTTNADGTKTTTTEKQDATKFCEENPTAAICQKPSTASGGGDCAASPVCSGDAVQCAMVTQVWKGRCEFQKVEDPGELQTKAVGQSSITPRVLASNKSCPASIALPKGMTFDFDGACMFANAMYPLVVGMAWLSALLLVLGGGTKEND